MDQIPSSNKARYRGRIVFLVDESEWLHECIAGGTKSKADSIATALNSVLNQLIVAVDVEVAVVGYCGDGSNGADVGCRWGGPLTGRRFVSSMDLNSFPLIVENRVCRAGMPSATEQEATVPFPIWYVPRIGESILPVLGYAYCRHLIVAGTTPDTVWDRPPLVISFVSDLAPQSMEMAVERVMGLSSPGGPPLLFHVHLGGSTSGRPLLYPASDGHLVPGPPCDLFRWSSALPAYMIAFLRTCQVPVNQGARGMIYNASLADLIRMLSLAKSYAQRGVLESLRPEGQG